MSDPLPEFSPPYRRLGDGPVARRLIWTSELWGWAILVPLAVDGLGRTQRESNVLALLTASVLLLTPVPARRTWRYGLYAVLILAALVLATVPRVPGGWAILLGLAAVVRFGRDLLPAPFLLRPHKSRSGESRSGESRSRERG